METGKKEEEREKPRWGFGTGLEKLVYEAVKAGIGNIMKDHEVFSEMGAYFIDHVDPKRVDSCIAEVYEELVEETGVLNIGELKNRISLYAASGQLFDAKGKKVILRDSLEEKTASSFNLNIFGDKSSREMGVGEKHLENVMGAFKHLYQLMKSGNYSQNIQDLSQTARVISDAGFFDAAISVLYDKQAITCQDYEFLTKVLSEKTQNHIAAPTSTISPPLLNTKVIETPNSIAAAIFGILGIAILLANSSLTGNVVGIKIPTTNIYGLIIGGLLSALSLLLFLRNKGR